MKQMGKVAVLFIETTIVCLFAIDRCTSCGTGSSRAVEGILGRNVSLSCGIPNSRPCNTVHWINDTSRIMVSNTARTSVRTDGDRHVMNIFRSTPYDEGRYRLVCTTGSEPSVNYSNICQPDLKLFCQAEVVVNLESVLHKSRQPFPSAPIIVDAYAGNRVKVKCSKGSAFTTNCRDVPRRESGDFTYNFQVLPIHHLCLILCQLQGEKDFQCAFNFSLNVSTIESSTIESSTVESSTTESSTSEYVTQPSIEDETNGEDDAFKDTTGMFRIIIPVGLGVFIVVFVGIAFLFWFFVMSSKLRTTENVIKVNTTANTHTLSGPQYENVHPEVYEMLQQEFVGSNHFYKELNCSMDQSKKLQQANPIRVQGTNIYESRRQVNPIEKETHSIEPTSSGAEYLEIEEVETEVKEGNPGLSLSNDDGYEIPRIH